VCRDVVQANPGRVKILRHEWEGLARKLTVIRLPRKASMLDLQVTVPQTDTGRREENSKVRE
jgi:hypothetical protein